jgi:hypothetical protein
MLTPETVRKVLRYDPESGKLFWLTRTADMFEEGKHSAAHTCAKWNARFSGKEAGSTDPFGYRHVTIDTDGRFLAHRLIWLLDTGEMPEFIDHIDGNPANNRRVNLRAVTRTENMRNCTLQARNKSGFPGVWWKEKAKRWRATGTLNGHVVYLGSFVNKEDAIASRRRWEAANGYHPNHGRVT